MSVNSNEGVVITANDNDDRISPAKKKLDSMVFGDGSFEALMKERSRLRKEKEEQSLAHILIQLTAAERALTTETQRRIQSTHNIQMSCIKKIQEMEHNFERILNERSLLMEERLATVHQKLEELTIRFEEEKDRVPLEMEARGKELLEMVESFQGELSQERSDRLSREGRILKQMNDHASYILNAVNGESEQREQISHDLTQRINENEQLRAQSENEMQAMIQSELSDLKGLIEKETKERKEEDNAIIMALNKYTHQLQSSLSVISS